VARTKQVDQRVAYHEAGHAVAAFLLGIKITQVTIDAGEDHLGQVTVQNQFRTPPRGDWDITYRRRARLEASVVFDFAGPEAESKHAGRKPTVAGRDANNVALGAHMAEGLADMHPAEAEAYLNWLQVRARLLVEQGWYLIEPLAQELRVRRSMSTSVVKRLLRQIVRTEAEAAGMWRKRRSLILEDEDGPHPVPLLGHEDLTARGWRELALQVGARKAAPRTAC
jgi:hypothetical protein